MKVKVATVLTLGCFLANFAVAGRTDSGLRPLPFPYEYLCFKTDAVGWVAGRVGIARTEDGGGSWHPLNRNLPTEVMDAKWESPLDSIYTRPVISDASFLDHQTAWVIARGGYVLETLDGGRSWIDRTPQFVKVAPSPTRPPLPYLTGLQFLDSAHGWIMAIWEPQFAEGEKVSTDRERMTWQELFRTRDGGEHWDLVSVFLRRDRKLRNYQFVDTKTGWAVDAGGDLRKTEDGGATWDAVANLYEVALQQGIDSRTSFEDSAIAFPREDQGWVLSWKGVLAEVGGDGSIRIGGDTSLEPSLVRSFSGLWTTGSAGLWTVARESPNPFTNFPAEPPKWVAPDDYSYRLLFSPGPGEGWRRLLEVPAHHMIIPSPQSLGCVWALLEGMLPQGTAQLILTSDGGRNWEVVSQVPMQEDTYPPSLAPAVGEHSKHQE